MRDWLALVARCFLAIGALSAAACSGYNSRWQAARQSAPGLGAPYAGAWDGRWTSSQHQGHGDRLQCILTPEPGNAHAYRAEFKATWLTFMTSEHSVVFHLAPGPSTKSRSFSGSAALKTLIGSGTYRCKGSITPTRMRARYDATYDLGTFELQRAK